MNALRIHWKQLIFLFIVISVFFFSLFYPTPKLIVTPDFGRSDAFHFSFATKFLLSQSLQNNTIPLWSSSMAQGFPILGEGQIGAFFLPNLILYKLFPVIIAYNLSLVLIFLFFAWGMYMLLQMLDLSRRSSVFCSISLTLSGILIPQIPHITLLQALSLLPILVYLGARYLYSPSIKRGLVFAFVASQQFLAGFPQTTVLTWGLIGLYIFFAMKSIRQGIVAGIHFVALGCVVMAFSAIQLLPSQEFLRYTSAPSGFDQETATYFSYPIKHLITFIDPFLLGNPKTGTYPAFFNFNGTIFWETAGYIGLLPLLFAISMFFRRLSSPKERKIRLAMFFLLCGSLLLMLGKYSPFYFVYSFWPLNLFRVPARFLWYFCLGLVVLAGTGMDRFLAHITKKQTALIYSFLLILQLVQIWTTWHSYHLITPYTSWIQPPESIQYLTKTPTVYSMGEPKLHNEYFLSNGWNKPDIYSFLKNSLSPNSNVLWNIRSETSYTGRPLMRLGIADSLLEGALEPNEYTATVSATATKLLQLFGITNIITPFTLLDYQSPTATISGDRPINIYSVENPMPRAYVAKQVVFSPTVQSATSVIDTKSYSPQDITLIEDNLEIASLSATGIVTVENSSDTSVMLTANNPNNTPSLLVLQDTYYPGWTVLVNGKSEKIYPVNIKNRGVIIPPGTSQIAFVYKPGSYYRGMYISGISLAIAIALMIVPASFWRRYKAFDILRSFFRL